MLINFNVQKTYLDSLSVEDAGNFNLRCTLVNGDEYYIAVQTRLGKMAILTIGPLVADSEEITQSFYLSYSIADFSEKTIKKSLDSVLNNPRNKILQVVEVELEEVLNMIPNQAKFIFRGEE